MMTQLITWLGRIGVLLLVVIVTAYAPLLHAGPQPSPTADSLLADQFVRLASQSLRNSSKQGMGQIEIARILLDLALEIHPDDIEAWRLRLDIAREQDDHESRNLALERYMKLVPDDDVARLEWIRLLIEQEQYLDARIEKVETLLDGPEAKELTDPVRSRLASYCAQAAREMGDEVRFKTRAAQALRFDQTNAEAAAMMYDEIVGRGHDPRIEGAALMWVVQADPLAMQPRRKLAELLLSQAAYEEAAQQFRAAQLSEKSIQSEGFYHDWILCRAAIGDEESTAEALQLLDSFERKLIDAQRSDDPKAQDEDDEAGQVDRDLPVPVLPLDLELLRLAILHQSDRNMLAQGSFGRIRNALTLKHANDERAGLDLAWLSAWLGPGVELEQIERLSGDAEEKSVIERIRAWMALREQRYDEAREIFERLADQDPFALYGLACCDRADPPSGEPVDRLEYDIVRRWPASLPGMMAARDLAADEASMEPTPAGRWLVGKLRQWPVELSDPNPSASPWTSVEIEFDPKRFNAFEPISAKLTLRNSTDVTLAFKPSGTIPSRLFLYVSPASRGEILEILPPIVVNMNRRLRLGPHEAIEVNSRIDRADFGTRFMGKAGQILTFNVTAILDPFPSPKGDVKQGIIGDRASELHLRYASDLLSIGTFNMWLERLDEPNPVKRMTALAQLERSTAALFTQIKYNKNILDKSRQAEEAELGAFDVDEEENLDDFLLAPARKDEIKDEIKVVEVLIDRIGKSISERFGQMSRVEQAWTIYFIPPSKKASELFEPVLQLARVSKDPLVRVTFMVFHVNSSEPQEIDEALNEDNPQISDFAKALRQRLESRPANVEKES